MNRFFLGAALAAALLLVPAAPAAAASGITSPGAGEVVAADAVVPLRAVVDGPVMRPSELTLRGPGQAQGEVVAVQTSPQGGELAYDFDTSCAKRLCTGRAPARNGTWILELRGGAQDERTFVLRIPPAAPVDVAAVRSERGVRVVWQQGDEPDLTGFSIEAASGALVRDGIGLDACDAERRCSVEVPEDAGAWSVRAFRSACPECAEVLPSQPSAVVRPADAPKPLVPAPDVPEAAPAPPPPDEEQTSARPEAQRDAFTRAFGSGRRTASAAAPAPAAAQPAAPVPDGAYDTTLGYAEQERVLSTVRPPGPRVPDSVASLATPDRLRLAVLCGLMIAVSVWLRRWARRAIAD